MGQHAPSTLPHMVRRLTVMVAVVAALMTGLTAGLVSLVDRDADRVDELRTAHIALLRVDEASEALRADLLAEALHDYPSRAGTAADLDQLRAAIEAADVAVLPRSLESRVREILTWEREFADETAAALFGPAGHHPQGVQDALTIVGSHSGRLENVAAELGATADRAADSVDNLIRLLLGSLAVAAAAVVLLMILIIRRMLLGSVREVLGDLEAGYQDQEQLGRITRALEQTETEADVHVLVARATEEVAPTRSMQLLVADASDMHLTRASGAGCGDDCDEGNDRGDCPSCCAVHVPAACPAMRTGRTRLIPSSSELDACPRLRDRPGDPISSVCVPVAFLGKSLGVLQVVGPDGDPPTDRVASALDNIAHLAGTRLGTMRALALAQRQATVDPLTGLLNRRTTDERVRAMLASETPYAVAMLDLDHFKALNDTYGHEVGDRALTMFARLMQDTLRADDIVSRHGGEEFVVVFPGSDSAGALKALSHVQAALAVAVKESGIAFTFSGGITDTRTSTDWRQQLRIADTALLAAKHAGRDRVLVGDPIVDRRLHPATGA